MIEYAHPLSVVSMFDEITQENLRQLEKEIRLIGTGSSLLMLEEINPGLIGELTQYFKPHDAQPRESAKLPSALSERSQGNQARRYEEEAHRSQQSTIANQSANIKPIEPAKLAPSRAVETDDLDPLKAKSLDSLRLRLRDCTRCKLWQGRKTIVTGQGNHNANLVFVGEGPGAEEDHTGLAFVGRAGQLLTQWIQSIGISRESVFICNVVKCRPPGNRNPEPDEIVQCSSFLFKQLELLNPKLIVTLGNIPTKTLLPSAQGITKMRGKVFSYRGIPVVPTFHPSFLLRQTTNLFDPAVGLPAVWNDMKLIRHLLFNPTTSSP